MDCSWSGEAKSTPMHYSSCARWGPIGMVMGTRRCCNAFMARHDAHEKSSRSTIGTVRRRRSGIIEPWGDHSTLSVFPSVLAQV